MIEWSSLQAVRRLVVAEVDAKRFKVHLEETEKEKKRVEDDLRKAKEKAIVDSAALAERAQLIHRLEVRETHRDS